MKKITIYTDGACSGNPGPMGAGAVLKFGDIVKTISQSLGQGTNNIAELQAVSLALSAIKIVHRKSTYVTLYSDSQYAVGVLTKWKASKNVPLILAIKELIREFGQVELIHCPGHANNEYNDLADNLARAAVKGKIVNTYV